MTTLTVKLSGKDRATETVEGFEIAGFFVHHPITDKPAFAKMWTISHCQSGMNLGTYFDKLKDAKGCAEEIAGNYDGSASAQGLIDQFKARGDKPSICDLAERHNASN
jgi:hypothetical protein